MIARNTPFAYGAVARTLHWLTALLIFAAFPLGMIAENLPMDTSEALARKIQIFSVHKTVGMAVFTVAVLRILWALVSEKPAPIHPERRAETFLAEVIHWALYLSLIVVPLSGWVKHAALDGFAPILWPFSQNLPFVPKSDTVAAMAGAAHFIFTKVLLASVLLHIAGALKHALIDRDGTLSRMVTGREAGQPGAHGSMAPLAVALALFVAGGIGAWQIAGKAAESPAPVEAAAPAAAGGNWAVIEGTLAFSVQQMGAKVDGSLPVWTASIDFDPVTGTGKVTVDIDTAQLTLGSVTDQAKGPEFFDTAAHPKAQFTANITPEDGGYTAKGTLSLRGASVPVTLPFTLTLDGGTATMAGKATLDRRDFAMGASYKDEATVGFAVEVDVALVAKQAN